METCVICSLSSQESFLEYGGDVLSHAKNMKKKKWKSSAVVYGRFHDNQIIDTANHMLQLISYEHHFLPAQTYTYVRINKFVYFCILHLTDLCITNNLCVCMYTQCSKELLLLQCNPCCSIHDVWQYCVVGASQSKTKTL